MVSGVVRFIKEGKGVTAFRLSVQRRKKSPGDKPEYFYITVKAFGSEPPRGLSDGRPAAVYGHIDSHKYQDRVVIEILCDSRDVYCLSDTYIQSHPNLPPGYPIPPADEEYGG